MAPYEALYGQKCRTPVCWDEDGERRLLGPELVQYTSDQIQVIKAKLKAAQDRQKSYFDKRHREINFEVGDQVYLKVSPWKGILRFGKKEKLSPRYIGPYEIIKRIGTLAYRLDLPPELFRIYNVFHICMLRKYVPYHSYVIRPEPVEL